jgi:hypothetical protein
MLHEANMREGQPIREVRIEARSVSAHARLAAALKDRGADPARRRPEAMAVNARSISAGEALKVLDQGWTAQAEGGLQVSWMLHGRPGVGKTELVQTLAERKGASLYDLRLTTIEPQDLRGLPFYDHEKGRTVWYRPEDLPDDPDRPAILFLDELTAAAPTLQPTVYGLLQERRVGRHRLPDSVFIVAAGNMVEDGAIAYEMGTALSDRLIHVIVQADADDWLKSYAPGAGIHPAVAAFLRGRPDLLETTEDALRRGHTIACTPRSWTRVSQILQAVPDRAARAGDDRGHRGGGGGGRIRADRRRDRGLRAGRRDAGGGAGRPGGDVSRHAPRSHRADLRADRRGG